MPLSLVTRTGAALLDAAACRTQLRWTSTDEDAYFTGVLIPAAEERAVGATRRALRTTTYDQLLDGFPCGDVLEFPYPPLQSVTSVQYIDAAGAWQTWSSSEYVWQAPAGERCARGRLSPAHGYRWPTVGREQLGCVKVRFVCGYADGSLPALLKLALLQDIGGMWEYRENLTDAPVTEIPMGASATYRSFRSLPRVPLPPGLEE